MALVRCTCLWKTLTGPDPQRLLADPFCPAGWHRGEPRPAQTPSTVTEELAGEH